MANPKKLHGPEVFASAVKPAGEALQAAFMPKASITPLVAPSPNRGGNRDVVGIDGLAVKNGRKITRIPVLFYVLVGRDFPSLTAEGGYASMVAEMIVRAYATYAHAGSFGATVKAESMNAFLEPHGLKIRPKSGGLLATSENGAALIKVLRASVLTAAGKEHVEKATSRFTDKQIRKELNKYFASRGTKKATSTLSVTITSKSDPAAISGSGEKAGIRIEKANMPRKKKAKWIVSMLKALPENLRHDIRDGMNWTDPRVKAPVTKKKTATTAAPVSVN